MVRRGPFGMESSCVTETRPPAGADARAGADAITSALARWAADGEFWIPLELSLSRRQRE